MGAIRCNVTIIVSKQIRLITTWPEVMSGHAAAEHKYRFAWTYPIIFSPHDSNTIYATGNIVFKTTNEGQSWQAISPDLTRAEPETINKPSGGVVNNDGVGAEIYATVFTFVESQHEKGVLWAGSDDGLIHISKDGGENWTNVTPSDLPEFTMISMLEQSPHDPATVYMAGTRYKLDDYQPYLYKTTDYGATWTRINNGIPNDAFTRVIREDPQRKGLLYAGTEVGLFISYDDGESWSRFQLNLPIAPIHDLVLKNNDLVVATHGRAFWILDDITPLHQIQEELLQKSAHLFTPRTTVRDSIDVFAGWGGGSPGKNYWATFGDISTFYEEKTEENAVIRKFLDSGSNPPKGALITYHLQEKPEARIQLTLRDADGTEIASFTSKLPEDAKDDKKKDERCIPSKHGMNRFVWDMRYPESVKVDGKVEMAAVLKGPVITAGEYSAELKVGDDVQTVSFEVINDPRVTTSAEDLIAQRDLLLQIRDKLSETNAAINRIFDLKQQTTGWEKRLDDNEELQQSAKELKEKLTELEASLINREARSGWESFNKPTGLSTKFASLFSAVASGDYAPTTQAKEAFADFVGRLNDKLEELDSITSTEVAQLNQQLQDNGFGAISG